jgi:hypothetical protein
MRHVRRIREVTLNTTRWGHFLGLGTPNGVTQPIAVLWRYHTMGWVRIPLRIARGSNNIAFARMDRTGE